MTQRSVTVTVNPVKPTVFGYEMNLSLSVSNPKHEITFTSLDSLKAALDAELATYTEPVALFFRLPQGTRKPPGFDAFTSVHKLRNFPTREA
jgi:hypothetical protein